MEVTYLCLTLILIVGARGENCTRQDGSDYVAITNNCTGDPLPVNCTMKKTCKIGYTGESVNLTCVATGDSTSWDVKDPPCTECEEPNYGVNCTSHMFCSSSCDFDKADGCTKPSDSDDECDLEKLKMTVHESAMNATVGLDEIINMTIYVNLPKEDVTVTVTFNGIEEVINQLRYTNGRGTYEYEVDVGMNSTDTGGIYMFKVTLKEETVAAMDEKNVTLKVYVPVEILQPTGWSPNEVEDVMEGDGNKTFKCEASGEPAPTVQWTYGGVNVSEAEVGSRVYQMRNGSSSTLYIRPTAGVQMKDSGLFVCHAENQDEDTTYTEVVQLNLVVRESSYKPVDYALQRDFYIAIGVIAGVLFLTIVAFIFFCLWLRRSYQLAKKIERQPKSRPNQYIHHTPRQSRVNEQPTAPAATVVGQPIQPAQPERPRVSVAAVPRPVHVQRPTQLPPLNQPPKPSNTTRGPQPPPPNAMAYKPTQSRFQPPRQERPRPAPINQSHPYPGRPRAKTPSASSPGTYANHRNDQIYKNEAFEPGPEEAYNVYNDTVGNYEDTAPSHGKPGSFNSTHSDYLRMDSTLPPQQEEEIYTEPPDEDPGVYEAPMQGDYQDVMHSQRP